MAPHRCFTLVALLSIKELIQLGTVAVGTQQNFAAPTTKAQLNVVRTGILLAQFSKPQNQYHAFQASVTAAGTNTSSFTIIVSINRPMGGMKLSFFLIIIKAQTTQVYIDLIPFQLTANSVLDNADATNRSIILTYSITSLTQFTTLPGDLIARSLSTSFIMYPITQSGQFKSDSYMQYRHTAGASSDTLTITIYAYQKTGIKVFRGIAILCSNGTVNAVAATNGWNMTIFANGWDNISYYSLASNAPSFGPSFYNKCYFGFNRITYKGEKQLNYEFTISSKGNFESMNFPDWGSDSFYLKGSFFCFGNGTACGQNQHMMDNISLTCHKPAQCPLKQFSTWTDTQFCPKCTHLICQNCTPSNRLNCLQCGVNSTLANGICCCNTDSWPFFTYINVFVEGMWSMVSHSLTECRYNCTAQITGCKFDKCYSGTFCTQCLVGFYLNVTGSTTDQFCYHCAAISNCLQCTSATTCTVCVSGYTSKLGVCTQCKKIIPNCITCNSAICFSCSYPYLQGSDGLCSRCKPGFYYISGICTNIAGCISMTMLANGTFACIACAPQLFFLFDTKTKKCVCIEGFKDLNSAGSLAQCKPVCGDGIIITQFQQCDDKNAFPRDGCDQFCKKQPGFDCGFSQPSKCILEINIESFVFNYISRVLGENKGIISYTIQPGHPGLELRPWNKIIKLNFPQKFVNQSHLSYSYDAETGQLLITVPYNQELEDTSLEVELTLDPAYIKSMTPHISLVHKLKGINSKLIFEDHSELQTHKNINLITLILTGILLLVFYLGSYAHKMIGLETIQVIQAIYFVRMITPSSSSSLLSSINTIQYASSGFQNAEWIYGDTEKIKNQLNVWTSEQFTVINLQKLFLLNANFSLIPILIVLIAYVFTLTRKYRSRNEYLETKEQQQKDNYTRFQRSSQWVYDHFVFPYIMMFNSLSFFQCVSLLSEPFQTEMNQLKKIQTQSFIFHVLMVLCTTTIYCYEISNSFQEYAKYRMTQKERQRVPKSLIEKLEHDENDNDKANYHPTYVLCHLAYYFILSVVMVVSVFIPDFDYPLELTMGIAIFYFIFIWIWKPYHYSIGSHNHFLKLYYGTYVLFLVICYLFGKLAKLEGSLYTAFMYVIMVLIGGIIAAGFFRIIFQFRFRKALSNDSQIMQWKNQESQVKQQTQRKSSFEQDPLLRNVNRPNKTKLSQLIQKNKYSFDNQLIEMNKKLKNSQSPNTQSKLTSVDKSLLIKRVQQDINKKKLNLILQNYAPKSSYRFGDQSKIQSVKIQKDSLIKESKGIKTVQSNIIDQIVQNINHKQQSSLNKTENHELNQLKKKLKSQWAYMHES